MMPHTGNLPSEAIKCLSLEQILAIHETLIKRYGGSYGIRDRGLLESAVFRPQTIVFGEAAYPTLFEKCAVLGYSIIQNHPFLDGNKRAGFAAMHLMLLINGCDLVSAAEEEIRVTENIASGKMREAEIAKWLKQFLKSGKTPFLSS
jgi:death on curing protein